MVFKIIVTLSILIAHAILLRMYIRSRRVIRSADHSLYPKMKEEIPLIHTLMGKIESVTLSSKHWKMKRFTIIFINIALLTYIALTIFSDRLSWENLLILVYVAIINSFSAVMPMFFITSTGICHDETHYKWESIAGFTVAPIHVASKGYGMFDDSPSYIEIKINTNKSNPSYIHVYVREETEVEKISNIMKQHGIVEIEEEAV